MYIVEDDLWKDIAITEVPEQSGKVSEKKIVDEPPKPDVVPGNKANGFSLLKLLKEPIQAWNQIVNFHKFLSES